MTTVYVLPFALYLLLTQIPPMFPDKFAMLYTFVVLVVGGAIIALMRGRRLLSPHRDIWAGLIVGVIGILLWIVLCSFQLESKIAPYLPSWLRPEPRPAFNPFDNILSPLALWSFIVIRTVGLAIIVPIAEELFWRGFLLRWVISSDWEQQPLGKYTFKSFITVTLLFVLAHPEWLAAAVYCAIITSLIYWKKDLWNCVVAHGVSNFILVVYVLTTGSWELW